MSALPTHRPPTHPGEMLLEEFLKPLEITQRDVADAIGVPYQRVNELVNGKRGITPDTALRLSKYLGTSAELWIGLQADVDLWEARRKSMKAGYLRKIRPLKRVAHSANCSP